MSEMRDGGPAFARPKSVNQMGTTVEEGAAGMTLRDWFAGQALAGMVQGGAQDGFTASDVVMAAYQFADAMLAAREVRS